MAMAAAPESHDWRVADRANLLWLHAALLAIYKSLQEIARSGHPSLDDGTKPLKLDRLPDPVKSAFEEAERQIRNILIGQWRFNEQMEDEAKDSITALTKKITSDGTSAFTPEVLATDMVRQWVRYGLWIARTREAIKKLKHCAAQGSTTTGKICGTFRGWVGSSPKFPPVKLSQLAGTLEDILKWASKHPKDLDSQPTKPWFWCADHAVALGLNEQYLTPEFPRIQTNPSEFLTKAGEDFRDSLSRSDGVRQKFLEDLLRFCGALQILANYGHVQPAELEERRRRLLDLAPKLLKATWTIEEDVDFLRARENHYVDWNRTQTPKVVCHPLFAEYPNAGLQTERHLICRGVIHAEKPADALSALRDGVEGSPGDFPLGDRLKHVIGWLTKIFTRENSKDVHLIFRLLVELDDYRVRGHKLPSEAREMERHLVLWGYTLQNRNGSGSVEKSDRCLPLPPRDNVSPNDHVVITGECPDRKLLSVGVLAREAACDLELLNSVGDVDWWIWLIREGKAAESVLAEARAKDWEPLKRRLLESVGDPETLAEAIQYCSRASLRLGHSSDLVFAPPLKDDLVTLQHTLLHQLHKLDPENLGGLDPPRDLNGQINVVRWLNNSRGRHDASAEWRIEWKTSESPFGFCIAEEFRRDDGVRVTVSSGSADPRDVSLLKLPYVGVWPSRTGLPYFSPGGPFDRFARTIISSPPESHGIPDIGRALESLRSDLSGPDQAAFHALVQAATATQPDEDASRWIRVLEADPRFRFECHPAIEWIEPEIGYRIQAVSQRDRLRWKDSETVTDRADLEVVYAIDKKASHRTLSRGCPTVGSAESIAREFEDLCEACGCFGNDDRALARDCRKFIDVIRTFPQHRDPAVRTLMETLCKSLDRIAAAGGRPIVDWDGRGSMMPLAQGLNLLCRLAEVFGHSVRPQHWGPQAGTPRLDFAADFPSSGDLHVDFHSTVSEGNVIVDRFDVSGSSAREGQFRRSAGPAPAGFEKLIFLAKGLPGNQPQCQQLRQALRDYPKHVLGDRSRLALPGLYDTAWNALLECPADKVDLPAWKAALAEILRTPFELLLFEPAGVGDYPSGWMVGVDGKPPRGRHIARVIRPGVRTFDKSLVWPAIVAME